MLEMAEQKRSSLAPELAHRLRFTQGDLRTVRLGERADAVISLFHVMSYQTSNADLTAAFATAREHLAEGGVFIFDCWYGRRCSPSRRWCGSSDWRMSTPRLRESPNR